MLGGWADQLKQVVGREWPIPCHNHNQALAVTSVSVRHRSRRSRHIPCYLPRSATHSRAANSRPAHVSRRSARVCPPGSGQGAGAAQGLWGPGTTGRGQDHLDRGLGVGLPAGMEAFEVLEANPGEVRIRVFYDEFFGTGLEISKTGEVRQID